MRIILVFFCCTAVLASPAAWPDAAEAAAIARTPPAGAVYREYTLDNGGNVPWRVTDPNARREEAHKFLPNPVLKLEVADLEHAVRARAIIDRWGGHANTANKCVRFNGHEWIPLPDITGTPEGTAVEKFLSQDNPIVDVPLEDLIEGINTIEGTCGVIDNYAWGQWGLYSVILRIYYVPEKKPHAEGRIISPTADTTLPGNPVIEVAVDDAAGVSRVDVLALHRNYDVNGDGVFREWVRSYHQYPERGEPAALRGHVGSATAPPFRVSWDTSWVPDQAPGSIQLAARIQSADGLWFVTDAVGGLSLGPRPYRVALYTASQVPPKYSSRLGKPQSCIIEIPESEDLAKAEAAIIHLRTWEGEDPNHRPFSLNAWTHPMEGRNHHFFYNTHEVPVSALRTGDNVFTTCSDTKMHGLEVLWPGPALTVRYRSK